MEIGRLEQRKIPGIKVQGFMRIFELNDEKFLEKILRVI